MRLKLYHIVIGIFIALIPYYFIYNKSKEINFYKNNMSALADTLDIYKDQNGNQVAEIQSLQTSKVKDIRDLKTSDSTILELKKIIRQNEKKLKNKGSVTTFSGETKIDTVFATEVRYEKDSLFPVYFSDINLDNWVIGNVEAKVDGVFVDLKIKNTYSIVIGDEKQGLFKKKVPFAMVTNYNPYSETTSLRTYQVDVPRKKRIHIGPALIYDPFSGQVRIGAGISYSIISF